MSLLRDREINNKIFVQLLEEREQARIREAAEIGNIRLIEAASIPAAPTRPRKLLNLIIGLFAGTVFGLVWIFAKEFMRDTPRTQEETESALDLPVLASVPYVKHGLHFSTNGHHRQRHLINNKTVSPLLCDAFSYLWSAVEFTLPKYPSVVMITSALGGEGKLTVAANLAIIAAQHGKKTILIDGDVRSPVIHQAFNMPSSPGLSNLVNEIHHFAARYSNGIAQYETNGPQARSSNDPAKKTEFQSRQEMELYDTFQHTLQELQSLAKLRIQTSGHKLEAPNMFWSSTDIREMLSPLKQSADLIVIDAPPVLGIPDANFIARHSDFVLLCVEASRTETKMLQRAQKIIANTSVKFLGVVLNKVEPASIFSGYKSYKYYAKQYKRSAQ